MDLLLQVLAGFGLAALIGLAAWKARSLSRSGALAATLLGTVIFGLGGLGWAIVLLGFFVSSSALSRLFRRQKRSLDEKFSKGSQRDAMQVLANGGAAGLFVLLHALFAPGQGWAGGLWWAAFVGTLAAANADTWATELGVLDPHPPRLVTTGQAVEKGASGGVSRTGLLAALAGALLIGLLGSLFWQGQVIELTGAPAWLADLLRAPAGTLPLSPGQALAWVLIFGLAGLLGSLLDSLLGASWQAIYFCPTCQKETERHPLHTCGTPTRHTRGLPWLDNDWVNIFCTLLGALVAAAAWLLMAR